MRLKSKRVLNEYIDFNKISRRELARRADKIAKKIDKNAGVGHAIVGHLAGEGKNARHSCNLVTARAIEEALGCPRGFLFEPSMSPVADSKRQKVAA